jgi:hypothetical protein
VFALVQAQPMKETAVNLPFFSLNGTLDTGQNTTHNYPIFNDSKNFNFSLTVTGTAPIELTITDSNAQIIWTGEAEGGETIWGYGT